MKLPEQDAEFFFGFDKAFPDWRTVDVTPPTADQISAIIGFPVGDLALPADSPAALVRRARKHAGGTYDLAPSFELAASLPEYMPEEMRSDAWRQAARVAAGIALESRVEKNPVQAEAMDRLAKGALKYARKYEKNKITFDEGAGDESLPNFQPDMFSPWLGKHVGVQGELFGKPPPKPAERKPTEGQGSLFGEEGTERPIKRWRDAQGRTHGPNPPGPNYVQVGQGARGGKIWEPQPKAGKKPPTADSEPQPQPRQQQPPASEPVADDQQAARITVDQVSQFILEVRDFPPPNLATELGSKMGARAAAKEMFKRKAALVSELSTVLAELTLAELAVVKKAHGLRAGGRKSVMAAKIAKAATKRITQREHWMREARKQGVRPADMLAYAKDYRENYNETIDLTNKVLDNARESYRKEFGKQLSRRMKVFDGGDYNEIRGFDTLSMAVAGRYPEVLGNHGYTSEGGEDTNYQEAEEKLFLIIGAGKQKRMAYGESQEKAIRRLVEHGFTQAADREREQSAVPFSRRGKVKYNSFRKVRQ